MGLSDGDPEYGESNTQIPANLAAKVIDLTQRTMLEQTRLDYIRVVITNLIKECNDIAKEKGWWDEPRSFGDQIALMHSELSEALEEFRTPKYALDIEGDQNIYQIKIEDWDGYTSGKPEGIAVELADVLIRIFDTCGQLQIPLAEALIQKIEYNKTRPYRHGGKKL